MFWNILTIENTKNLKRTLLWVELLLLGALVIATFSFLYVAIQGAPEGVTISNEDNVSIAAVAGFRASVTGMTCSLLMSQPPSPAVLHQPPHRVEAR